MNETTELSTFVRQGQSSNSCAETDATHAGIEAVDELTTVTSDYCLFRKMILGELERILRDLLDEYHASEGVDHRLRILLLREVRALSKLLYEMMGKLEHILSDEGTKPYVGQTLVPLTEAASAVFAECMDEFLKVYGYYLQEVFPTDGQLRETLLKRTAEIFDAAFQPLTHYKGGDNEE